MSSRHAPIEITRLLARLAERGENTLSMFEGGKLVERRYPSLVTDVERAVERLARWGVEPGMRVGIRAPNSYAWMIYDLALIERRAVSMALTEDFADTPAEELIERYGLALLLVGGGAEDPPAEGPVVAIDRQGEPGDDVRRVVDTEGTDDPGFDRPFLIFSSGSAGGLKGLTLDRRGVEATVAALVEAVEPGPRDRLLLFLPMSNFQQRMMYYAALWYGFDLVVVDPPLLLRALQTLAPTHLIAPPALYEAIETRFLNLPAWQRRLATAVGALLSLLPDSRPRTWARRRVFRQIHQAFGGSMRFMITGMAPIKRSTLELFEKVGLPLFETYGLIECGSVSLNLPRAHRPGSVGKLLPGVEVELWPDGEIIARRQPNVAVGYFQCAAGEAESTFLGDHRVATGDIGCFDDDGFLYLVGRKKEILITSGGEKIHPERIEAEIDACPEVEKAVVLGHRNTPGLVAVVRARNPEDIAARQRISAVVEGIGARRPTAEVARLIFTEQVFSRDNGFLRPNLKLDRRRIAEFFLEEATP